MKQPSRRVGLIGLGTMGGIMAQSLVEADTAAEVLGRMAGGRS